MGDKLAGMLLKAAQEKRKAPPRTQSKMVAYPDYSKSLAHQRKKEPVQAGLERGLGTGITGAAFGAVVARVLSKRPEVVAGGALAGGALGGAAGYVSGKREAESDYSKILFLRRRLGVNEPGELDAVLKHPALAGGMIAKESHVKQAALSPAAVNILKGLGVVGAGAGGYALGAEGTSRLIGYHDDPAARHVGGYVNAANATAIALALALRRHPAYGGKAMKALLHPGALGAMAGMEVIPAALRSANRAADSVRTSAENQIAPTAGRLLTSPAGRGAVAGAGTAGVAALLSGLLRARTDREIADDTGRAGLVGKDFGKYVLPATLVGGVLGSLRNRAQ